MELETILDEFYTTKSQERRRELHDWLLNAKNSPETWKRISTLLAFNRPSFVHHFAAGAIQEKVARQWEQLVNDEGEIDRLRELLPSLLERCQFAAATESKLISALATLILRCLPDVWANPLEDLKARWGASSPRLLFMLAAELPTCFKETTFRVERRNIILGILTTDFSKVASWCERAIDEHVASSSAESHQWLAVSCIESWMDLSASVSPADWLPVVRSWLLVTTNVPLDKYSALLASMIQKLAENQHICRMDNFIREMFHYMSNAIVPKLMRLLDKPSELDDEDCALMQAVAAFCENHASVMLSVVTKADAAEVDTCIRPLLTLFLRMSAVEGVYSIDENISDAPGQLWQSLEEEVTLINEADRTNVCSVTGDYFRQLAQVTVLKAVYPKDATEWDLETKETFENYRRQLGDVSASCYRLLNEWVLVEWEKILMNDTLARHGITEAALFAFESVADYVTTDSSTIIRLLSKDLEALSERINSDVRAINTQMTLLDRLVHIVASCDMPSSLLVSVCKLILPHIEHQATSKSALFALEHLVSERIPENDQGGVYDSVITRCYSYFSDESNDELLRLRALRCIGYSLSMKSDAGTSVIQGLNQILAPRLEKLGVILSGQQDHADKVSKGYILFQLSVVSTLTATLDRKQERSTTSQPATTESAVEPSAVTMVLESSFPLFESLLVASGFDNEVATKICGCLIHGLYAVVDRRLSFVSAYCRIITSMLPANHVAFTVAKPLLLVFATGGEGAGASEVEDECSRLLGAALVQWTALFPPLLANTSACDVNGDACEAFFQFAHQVVKKHCRLISEWGSGRDALAGVLDCACLALASSVNQPQLIKHVALVLAALLSGGLERLGANQHQLISRAEQLIQLCYGRMKTELVLSTVEYLADVLFNFARMFPGETRATLKDAIAANDKVSNMLQEIGNKRRFRTLAKTINVDARRR